MWLCYYYDLIYNIHDTPVIGESNILLKNSQRAILETSDSWACDHSDEETWPDQQNDNDKDKDNDNDI